MKKDIVYDLYSGDKYIEKITLFGFTKKYITDDTVSAYKNYKLVPNISKQQLKTLINKRKRNVHRKST